MIGKEFTRFSLMRRREPFSNLKLKGGTRKEESDLVVEEKEGAKQTYPYGSERRTRPDFIKNEKEQAFEAASRIL